MNLEDLKFPFWFDSQRGGASLKQIEEFERDLGVKLPRELRKALMLRDGGVSTYSAFRLGHFYVPMPAFFGVEELRRAEERREEFGTPRGVIAIASGAHEWLALDYRDGPVPRVVFQESEDHELEAVADNFEDMLAGLVEE